MRFRPTSLKPHPVERPEKPSLTLRPGHAMKRGVAARKGHVAWNQPFEGGENEHGAYNTVRPFFAVEKAVRCWGWCSPREDAYGIRTAVLEWMAEMEEKKDWREVMAEKVDALEQIADELKEYALFHMGKGGIQPFGAKSPYPPKAGYFAKAAGEMTRCIVICRLRMEENYTAAMRRKNESNQLSRAIDAAEAEANLAAWDKKVAPTG